jgi:hypothetical protein
MWELNYLPKLFDTIGGFKPDKFGTFILTTHIEFHYNLFKTTDLAGTRGLQTMKITHSWFANHENLHIHGMRTIICAEECFYFWPRP